LGWTWESEGKDAAVEGPKLVEKYKIATWNYPVHNRAAVNPHKGANPHGGEAATTAAPASIENTPTNGVVKDLKKPEYLPNPLTNCSVCHY
jgi:hypothetical protein